MITQVTYQGNTSTLSFDDWASTESYLLKWISKPIHLTFRFESITGQLNYYHELTSFFKSVVLAQQAQLASVWDIHVYGFDHQEYTIDLAA